MEKIAFLFPGQGSQYVGMGKTLYDKSKTAQQVFNEAEKILGYDIKKLCFEGTFEELTKPEFIQPAILTVSVAAFRVFEEEIDAKPEYFLGHSFGELSALVCAGVISFVDALRIAKLKGEYVQKAIEKQKGGMTIVNGVDEKLVRKICEEVSVKNNEVVIGMVNSPKQIVITGHEEALREAEKKIVNKKGEIEHLRVKAPFHSSILKPAAEKIKKDLEKIKYQKFNFPVISSVTGKIYKDASAELSTGKKEIIQNLSDSLIKEVVWIKPVEFLVHKNISTTIEIGPQKVLTNLMKDITDKIESLTFNKLIDLEVLKKRFKMDKASKLEVIIQCVKVAVCTKNSNWNDDEYERGVAMPYRKVKERLLAIEKDNLEPKFEDVVGALEMLDSVFRTKGTEKQEIKERWDEVFPEDYKTLREIIKNKANLNFL